ncbi:helix-turn-helix transcriptional regulator [Bacillus cereus]|uniref:helix-turn-helix transcriptional regulator n=1 Tax=Bacillus cereus TaxID=1396 RepID=UPI000BEDB912|nr:helix-turn-helix transcriptional regulator [Bacillus cereus]PEE35913.1 transcriptional regulator [Bacillus cereus]PET34330.1 transcriptional regulator [Bacillus cereus]PEV75222.1 transcriptional regulator [Bacillus cereus]PFA40877.1 transcriptional regulator [Bacillus cereus]PFD62340.1 transcriptional regulator [Bacillus cereus]
MKRDWLVKIRKQHELTQVDIAEALNVSPTHYSDIESGRRTPGSSLAMKIATFLEFPVEWLLLPSYLHNAEKWVLKLAMQMDFPSEEIFLNSFPRIAEKVKSCKKTS